MSFTEYCKRNKAVLFISCGFILLSYGFRLFNYAPIIDTPGFIIHEDFYLGWIGNNRFGPIITNWIFGILIIEPASVYFLTLVALLLAGITWNYLFSTVRQHTDIDSEKHPAWQSAVFPALFFTSACLYEMLHFECLAFDIAFALVLLPFSLLQLTLSDRNKKYAPLRLIIATLGLVWVFATYQALVPLALAAIIGMFLLHSVHNEDFNALRYILKYAVVFVAALILYYITARIIAGFYGLTAGYLSGQFFWGIRPFLSNMYYIFDYARAVILAQEPYYNYLYAAIALLLLGFIVWFCVKRKKNRVITVCATLLLIGSPFFLAIALGNAQPARTQMCLPFFTAFGAYFLITLPVKYKDVVIKQKNIISAGKIIAAASVVFLFIAFRQGIVVSRFAYTDYMVYNQQVMLTTQITDRIGQLNLGAVPEEPVAIYGSIPPAMNRAMIRGDTTPSSHFAWDTMHETGTTHRVHELFRSMGIYYNMPSGGQIRDARELSQDMPPFPHSESVQCIDGIIIVKLQYNWVQNSDGSWSYLNSDGSKYTGWLYDRNYRGWYYLKENGIMAANETLTIDGYQVKFKSDGAPDMDTLAWLNLIQKEGHQRQ